MTTMWPGLRAGASICSHHARKTSPSIGPSSSIGAMKPASVRPPTKVTVFQCPWGMAAWQRWPRGAHPRRRVILVESPLSSIEELPDRRPDHPHIALRSKPIHHLVERRVGLLPQGAQDEVLVRIQHRALGLALLGWPNVALRALQPAPGSHRRYPDQKARRRLARRHPFFERRHNALPQIQAVRLSHRSLHVTGGSESFFSSQGNPMRLSFPGKRSSRANCITNRITISGGLAKSPINARFPVP